MTTAVRTATASPALSIDIPDLDDTAIERLAEAMLPLLDQFAVAAADDDTIAPARPTRRKAKQGAP